MRDVRQWEEAIGAEDRGAAQAAFLMNPIRAEQLGKLVEFTNPSLDLRSPAAFGVITSQGNTPRAIQIGFRVEF